MPIAQKKGWVYFQISENKQLTSSIPVIRKIARRVDENKHKGRFAKFFLFTIGGKTFSIAVEDVAEVSKVPQIMSIPEGSDLIYGVINIRGSIVPIIDIKKKTNLPSLKTNSADHQLLILWLSKTEYVGIIVDSIEYRLKDGILEDIRPEVKNLNENSVEYAIINEKKYPVFNINNWLNETDMSQLKKVVETF